MGMKQYIPEFDESIPVDQYLNIGVYAFSMDEDQDLVDWNEAVTQLNADLKKRSEVV